MAESLDKREERDSLLEIEFLWNFSPGSENSSSLDRAIRPARANERIGIKRVSNALVFGLFRRAHENAWVGSLGPCAFARVSGTVAVLVTLETVSISTLSYAVGNQHQHHGSLFTLSFDEAHGARFDNPITRVSLSLSLSSPPPARFFPLVLVLRRFVLEPSNKHFSLCSLSLFLSLVSIIYVSLICEASQSNRSARKLLLTHRK